MSLQSDIMTALSGLGADKAWPEAVPDEIDPPFVVYRVQNEDPETTLDDSVDDIKSLVVFESYGEDYAEALSLSASVVTALRASGMNYFRESSLGDDYIPLIDGYVKTVVFSFWHN